MIQAERTVPEKHDDQPRIKKHMQTTTTPLRLIRIPHAKVCGIYMPGFNIQKLRVSKIGVAVIFFTKKRLEASAKLAKTPVN